MSINSEPFLLDNKKYDIDLSIVVPAYNEVQRLPTMMKETLPVKIPLFSLTFQYLQTKIKEGRLFKKVEILIVNDGSKDETGEMIRKYTEQSTDTISIRGLSLLQNQGKGAAVKYV